MQTTKDSSQFGKGEIRGVIGPESSNNAKEGGGLVPTLLFGVPGSGSMAVFIGGLILLGYDAGPQMVSTELPLTYTIVWSLALANVIGAGLCIILSPGIARLTTIRFALLVPFLFMLIAFAAFQSKQTLWDLTALLAIGMIGIFMRRFEWPRPAFLIGFVLASQAEVYTYQVTQIASTRFNRGMMEGLQYIFSPVTIVLIIITVVSVFMGARQSRAMRGSGLDEYQWDKRPAFLFTVFIALFFALNLYEALYVDVLIDKVFPLVVSGLSLVATLALLLIMARAPANSNLFADYEANGPETGAVYGLWPTLGWFMFLLALTALFGFIIALTLFFITFLLLRAQASLPRTLILTVAGVGAIIFMASVLNREFPPGLLQDYVELPWPLRGR
jgi:hypothetical protein